MNERIMTAGRVAILAVGVAALGQTMHFSYGVVATLQAPTSVITADINTPAQDTAPIAGADQGILVVAAQAE